MNSMQNASVFESSVTRLVFRGAHLKRVHHCFWSNALFPGLQTCISVVSVTELFLCSAYTWYKPEPRYITSYVSLLDRAVQTTCKALLPCNCLTCQHFFYRPTVRAMKVETTHPQHFWKLAKKNLSLFLSLFKDQPLQLRGNTGSNQCSL